MKKITILFILLNSLFAFSQKEKTKEFSIQNDNDLYTSISRDRYYTNGFFLSYKYLNKGKHEKAIKKISKIAIGQKLYSPQRATVILKEDHDRPFAAYLYGEFEISNFYKDNSILKLNTQIGMLGPKGLGKETMAFVHKLLNFENAEGWKYQISNAFALNFRADYIKNIEKISTPNFAVDLVTAVNIGTVFTNASAGVNIRIGLSSLKSISNSLAYNGNLNNDKTKSNEFFIFLKPLVNYIMYDATIQGSFLNDSSPITYDVKPLTFTSEFGIAYAISKINLGYSMVIHSKKLKSQEVPKINNYGSIFISYLFN